MEEGSEKKLLVGKRQMMCDWVQSVQGMWQRITGNELFLFVDITELLGNQNAVSVELIMSVLDRIGDYELLEKQKEGYERD